MSNNVLAALAPVVDSLLPAYPTGNGLELANVSNGETIIPDPRTNYDLGSYTNLTFMYPASDIFDTSGFDQKLTFDSGGGITINDTGYLLNLVLNGTSNVTINGFNHDFFGHVTLNTVGSPSNIAPASSLVSDGYGGSKLTNGVGQTIVDFAKDPLALARTQLTVHT